MNTPPPAFIAPLFDAVGALIDNPTHRALVVSCEPDLTTIAARCTVARLRHASPAPLALSANASLPDCTDLTSDLLIALEDCIAPWRTVLSRLPDAPEVPTVPLCSPDDRHPEDTVAVTIERIARALWSVSHPLVLALHADPDVDPNAFTARVNRLASGIASPWVKFILFDDRHLFDDLHTFSTVRTDTRSFVHGLDDPSRIARWFADDTRHRVRILTAHPGAAQAFASHSRSDIASLSASVVVSEPFIDRRDHCEAVLSAVISTLNVCDREPRAWRDALYDDRSLEAPEATLAELVERAATERPITVLLQPTTITDRIEWQTFCHTLITHTASPTVRWCLFDDAEAPALSVFTPAVTVNHLRFAPSVSDLNAALDTSPIESPNSRAVRALRHASDAVTHRRWPQAITLGAEAVVLARHLDSAVLETTAWGVLSRALRGDGDLDAAQAATERSLTRALATEDPAVLGQALNDHADLAFHRGAFDEAEESYMGAARAWGLAQRVPQRAIALEWCAEVRRARRDYRGAAQGLDEAKRAWQSLDGPGLDETRAKGIAGVLGRLARLWSDAGERSKSAALTRERLAVGPLYEPPERP